ncbi:MAG: hypothetical protein R6V85_11410 [Polyangia bacterium]
MTSHRPLSLELCAAVLLAAACTPGQREISGDVTITSTADLERLESCVSIEGSLAVKRSELTSLVLPHLRELGGRLAVQKNPELKEIDLGALEKLGGEAVVERNGELEALDLGALVAAPRGLAVRLEPRLKRLDLKALRSAGGSGVEIADDYGIRELDLGALAGTTRLVVGSCHRLERLDLRSLVDVRKVRILANPHLERILVVDPLGGDAAASERRAPAPKADQTFTAKHNNELPTCEARRLHERLEQRGWRGRVEICENAADTCSPVGCSDEGR